MSTPSFHVPPEEQTGYLSVNLGPMFSSKSTFLVHILSKYADLGYRVCYINYSKDQRETDGGDGKNFSSHNSSNRFLSPKINCFSVSELASVNVEDLDVIGIDESHFYPDLYEVVMEWVEKNNKHVIVCGLDGSFQRKPIGETLRLLPKADHFVKMTSQCKYCIDELKRAGFAGTIFNLEAPFTLRKTASLEVELVGGSDTYEAVCRRHYIALTRNSGSCSCDSPPVDIETTTESKAPVDVETTTESKAPIDVGSASMHHCEVS